MLDDEHGVSGASELPQLPDLGGTSGPVLACNNVDNEEETLSCFI